MRVYAKADYALRAMAQLASEAPDTPVTAEHVSAEQDIPLRYLLAIFSELKHGRLVRSSRGASGGYSLSRPADEITLADIIVAFVGAAIVIFIASLLYRRGLP